MHNAPTTKLVVLKAGKPMNNKIVSVIAQENSLSITLDNGSIVESKPSSAIRTEIAETEDAATISMLRGELEFAEEAEAALGR